MKIRTGFVSNSSSSSFIVVLDKPISQYSFEEFLTDYDLSRTKHAERLFKDLNYSESNILSASDDCYISVDIDCAVLDYDIRSSIEKELIEYGKKLIQDRITTEYDIVDDTTCKYIIEYSDNDGDFFSEMEHDFMPTFKGTKKIISHH